MSQNGNSIISRRSQRKRHAVQENIPDETPRALLEKVCEEKALRKSSPYVFNAEASNIAKTSKGKKSPVTQILLKEKKSNDSSASNRHASKKTTIDSQLNLTALNNKPSLRDEFFKGRRTSRKFTFSHKAASKVENLSAEKQKTTEKSVAIESSSDDDDAENNSTSKSKNRSKRKIKPINYSLLHVDGKTSLAEVDGVISKEKFDSQNKKDKSRALKIHSEKENKLNTLEHYFTSSTKKKRIRKSNSSMLIEKTSLKNVEKKSNEGLNENNQNSCLSSRSLNNSTDSIKKKGNNNTLNKSPIQPRRRSLRLDEKEKNVSQKVSDQTSPKTRSTVDSFVRPKNLSSVSVTSPLSSASGKRTNKQKLNEKELKNKRLEELKRAEMTPSVCNASSETYSDSSEYCSRKLHSTALNADPLPLTFDGSSIEPIVRNSTLHGKTRDDQLDAGPSSTKSDHQKTGKGNCSQHANHNSNQVALEWTAESANSNIKKCNNTGIPINVTCDIIRHFADMPVAKSAIPILTACCEDFWKQTLDVLIEYSEHAGRDSIDVSDVELLLYRQGNIRDRNSMNAVIAKYLPLEIRSEIIPIASAGNVVYPRP